MRNFLLMVQFMTRYPVPLQIEFSSSRFIKGMKWMPLVGLLVGLPGALTLFLFHGFLGKEMAVLFALIATIGVTGGLHLDGIGDTADGLFSYRPKEKVLEIMRDSTLGTNGVVAIILTILIKFICLKNLSVLAGTLAMFIAPVVGRMGITWHAAFSNYARDGSGMGEFVEKFKPESALAATLLSMFICSFFFLFSGSTFTGGLLFILLLHAGGIAFAVLFARYLKHRIGGITGDTMGTTIELIEIITFIFFLTGLEYLS